MVPGLEAARSQSHYTTDRRIVGGAKRRVAKQLDRLVDYVHDLEKKQPEGVQERLTGYTKYEELRMVQLVSRQQYKTGILREFPSYHSPLQRCEALEL